MATLEQTLHNIIKKAIEEKEIPFGSLLLRKNHEELLYTQEGTTRDAIFRIYSMTKPVTSAAVMKLIEAGVFLYNDPVSKFLPGFLGQRVSCGGRTVPVEREVTIRDLMNMTSGMPYGNTETMTGIETQKVFDEIDSRLLGDAPFSTIEVANRLGSVPLLFQPGEGWEYGVSADILGAVIEVATGQSFGTFVQKEILEPLEMYDSGFTVKEENKSRLVTAYERTEDGQMREYHGNHLGIINAMDRAPSFESGGAGLTSTIDDYSHFAEMLLSGGCYKGRQILKERTVRFMTEPKLNEKQCGFLGGRGCTDYEGFNYGNLMRIMEDERRAPVIGSNGEYGWDGWLGTYFCNSPADELTILFMTQKKDSGWLAVVKRLHNVIFSELAK